MAILISVIAFLTALMPALVWLIFFLREDVHPEPKRMIAYTFAVGGLISFPVLATQIIFQTLIPSIIQSAIILIIGLALIEEVFKFLAAYWAVNNKPAFDEPIDAMIYMIAAALGFATVENIFIVGNSLNLIDNFMLNTTMNTLSLRFVGATLLHTLTSGLVGYYWARARMKKSFAGNIAAGLTLATIIHTIFNYLILKFQTSNLLYPSVFLIVAAFFLLNDFEKLKAEEVKTETSE